ncbi:MAG: FAD-dependent oxidoreductase [Spirochaetes bacterium]|nr:FAD-dependent oxidoreductase [Spirochaetota bacterium]
MKKYDVLVIGGDAAGMSAASQARRTSDALSIAVLEKGAHVSYAACGLPYYIADDVSNPESLIAIDLNEYIKERKIDILLNTEAIAADFVAHTVTIRFQGGVDTVEYGKLVIATGARPIVPPIRGIDAPNVFFLRNLADGMALRRHIDERMPSSGIIIGGGFIGLEMAEAFRKRSIETVILEKFDSVAMTMSPVIRSIILETLRVNDVRVITGAAISEILPTATGLSVTAGDNSYAADLVIASTGITPNTEFLNGTGIRMNDRGAIIVDEKSKTSVTDVFAAGDCATVKHQLTGKNAYMPLGTTANKQGRVAGLQAAGIADESFPGIVGTQMVKVFDLEVGKTGMNEADALRAGVPAESTSLLWRSRAGYYPAGSRISITLTMNPNTRELVGGEIAGTDGAALRINTVAAAIAAKMKVEQVAYLDLGYAPPFSPIWDPVNAAAQKMLRTL